MRDETGVVIAFPKRGPTTELSDDLLLVLIRRVIKESPFSGEGHRKVTSRLRREHGVHAGRKRVLRLMRLAGRLTPQRGKRRRKARSHDGTIIPQGPDLMWAPTRPWRTRSETGGCGRSAASITPPLRRGRASPSAATASLVSSRSTSRSPTASAKSTTTSPAGSPPRHDWGPQYTSGHFQGAIEWLGIEDSPAFAGEPPCNGCAERFIRTLKEQCLWARLYDDVEDLRQAVIEFTRRYNEQWLIERHGHRTPREAYAAAKETQAA